MKVLPDRVDETKLAGNLASRTRFAKGFLD